MSKKNTKDPIKKLSVRQTKFVKGKLEGKTSYQAYKDAGYKVSKRSVAEPNAHRLAKKDYIQQAIDNALAAHGLTPEYAVGELAKIVAQDRELASKRLAIKDVLELHGFNKNSVQTPTLQINNSFFASTRANSEGQVIDL